MLRGDVVRKEEGEKSGINKGTGKQNSTERGETVTSIYLFKPNKERKKRGARYVLSLVV